MQQETSAVLSEQNILSSAPETARQLLLAFFRSGDLENFLDAAFEDSPAMVAYLSYWEKWFPEQIRKIIDEKIGALSVNAVRKLPLGLEQRFNEEELRIIFANLKSIQLTFGCSFGCPRCGIDAPKGVREHIPFRQLEYLFSRYGRFMYGNLFLYWASDPYDYRHGRKRYPDVHKLAVRYTQFRPHVTSKEIENKTWLKFMRGEGIRTAFYPPRVSAHDLSEEKITALEKFFTGGIFREPSRTWLVGKKTSHMGGIGVHVENSPSALPLAGIGCFDGMLLTPRGLYNFVQIPVSQEFPQGHIVAPFENYADEEIREGNSLAEALRHAVVIQRWNRRADYGASDLCNIRTGAMPQKVHLRNQRGVFRICHNESGTIISSERVPDDMCARAERIQAIRRSCRAEWQKAKRHEGLYYYAFAYALFAVLWGIPLLSWLAEWKKFSLPFNYHAVAAFWHTGIATVYVLALVPAAALLSREFAAALWRYRFGQCSNPDV